MFQIKEEGKHIRIVPETFLYERRSATTQNSNSADKSGALLSHKEFQENLRMLLSDHLRTRLMEADDTIMSHLSIFDPDVQCASDGKRHKDHAATGGGWFSERLRFHLLRIMILDNLHVFSKIDNFHSRICSQRCGTTLFHFAAHPVQNQFSCTSLDGYCTGLDMP